MSTDPFGLFAPARRTGIQSAKITVGRRGASLKVRSDSIGAGNLSTVGGKIKDFLEPLANPPGRSPKRRAAVVVAGLLSVNRLFRTLFDQPGKSGPGRSERSGGVRGTPSLKPCRQADRRLDLVALENVFKSLLAPSAVSAAPISRRGAVYMGAFRTTQPPYDGLTTNIRAALRAPARGSYEGGGIP